MPRTRAAILSDPVVRAAFKEAWIDSSPGISGGHEEGGFVAQDASGNLSAVRWPGGTQNSIRVPPHPNCRIGDGSIVASFHTHPNTGSDYLQEPGETDKRSVRDDPDLKGADYVGEFVVSQEIIFLISPNGRVRNIAQTPQLFAEV